MARKHGNSAWFICRFVIDGDEISDGFTPRVGVDSRHSRTSCGWLSNNRCLAFEARNRSLVIPTLAVIETNAFVIFQDLVTELPEKYNFDLGKSIGVFWLRRCMRNVWKLAHEIERLDRAAHVQVEKSMSSGTFPWWKASSDRHLGSIQANDTIRDWRI
ncbi:hypothetical protein ARMGADRAFT_1071253 [Armillaria gallica]|uniref:Uncharacterized protein n=1 Tax=Armillaria gallica TaxID=47427 RepID=A0A2H3E2S8_ARMGA|nr:hypothetical protein ARMGADRAFT_1071253 [Armillaria gallica]